MEQLTGGVDDAGGGGAGGTCLPGAALPVLLGKLGGAPDEGILPGKGGGALFRGGPGGGGGGGTLGALRAGGGGGPGVCRPGGSGGPREGAEGGAGGGGGTGGPREGAGGAGGVGSTGILADARQFSFHLVPEDVDELTFVQAVLEDPSADHQEGVGEEEEEEKVRHLVSVVQEAAVAQH